MAVPNPLPPSPFSQAADQLLANGYSPLPISPLSKAPSEFRGGKWRPMQNWQRFRETPVSSFILRAWGAWPECNIGILTGTRATATHVVACVDYDSDDPDTLDELQRSLPQTPVRKRGKRGHSGFYLVPAGTIGFRTSIVELLTDTRQTVIPPSVHPDTGRPYQWLGEATLLNTPAAALPVLTEDDISRFRDTVESLTKSPIRDVRIAAVPQPLDNDANVWMKINAVAFGNLDAWVPELGLPKLQRTQHGYKGVAFWRPSTTGRPIPDRKANLSIVAGVGARDHGTGESYSGLDLAMAAFGMDLDTAFGWLAGRLGLAEEGVTLSAPPPQPETPPTASAGDPAQGQEQPPPPPLGDTPPPPPDEEPEEEEAPEELPAHLTNVPGLLGQVIDWVADGARRPNRVLALGAAVTILGTMIGQAIAGPTGSATHLYVVGLAPSGAGKDHPLQCVSRAMKASNNALLLGPSEFISMPAVINFLVRKPLAICAMDEIGAFLKRLVHPRASAYEKSITKILRTVWGTSFAPMMTPEWAAVKATEIDNPALSIYGVSTPAEFFSALEGDDVVNGFLNRWLLLATNRKVADRDPVHQGGHVPPELALALAQLRNEANALTEADRKAPLGDGKAIKRMVWNGGRSVYEALLKRIDRICRDEEVEPYFARTAEMAVRLATIRAAGCGRMQVTAEDMFWGRDVALWSAQRMARLGGNYIAENDNQRTHNKVMRIIAGKGGRITHRDLLRVIRGGITSRGLKDIMDQLMAAGEVVAHKSIPLTGGPPTITYELRRT